jgi:NADH:ubiquinone oxidoreductase subunit
VTDAREVVKDTLGIDLLPYQLVERDAEGNRYRTGAHHKTAETARRWAMYRNETAAWRPTPGRWWAVMGPEGWEA